MAKQDSSSVRKIPPVLRRDSRSSRKIRRFEGGWVRRRGNESTVSSVCLSRPTDLKPSSTHNESFQQCHPQFCLAGLLLLGPYPASVGIVGVHCLQRIPGR